VYTIVLHNTARRSMTISALNLQTIITAQMLSIWGKLFKQQIHDSRTSGVWAIQLSQSVRTRRITTFIHRNRKMCFIFCSKVSSNSNDVFIFRYTKLNRARKRVTVSTFAHDFDMLTNLNIPQCLMCVATLHTTL